MKTLILATLLCTLAAPAFADDAPVATLICNLADLGKPLDQANIFNVVVSLKANEDKELPAGYQGRTYSVMTHDWSDSNGGTPRHQITVSARAADGSVVGSAMAIYSVELPELQFQIGSNVLLDCMPK